MRARLAALIVAVSTACASLAQAAPLARPEGPVILRVSGAIAHTNAEGAAEFDLAMLEDLGVTRIVASTPWYEEARDFSGPLVSTILKTVGAQGATLRVTAINDYSAELPASDAADFALLLATRIDGKTVSVRDKGPSFLIYPFDDQPKLYNEVYFGRCVWQIREIEVF